MFQFRRFPAYAYLIQRTLTEYCSAGFPHSEICGSKLICSSPQLIAACHVLLRLLMPRHSPCALSSLTSSAQAPYRSSPPCGEASFTPLRLLSSQSPSGFPRQGTRSTALVPSSSSQAHCIGLCSESRFSSRIMQASEFFGYIVLPIHQNSIRHSI